MSADGEQGGTFPQSKAFRVSLSHQQRMFDAQHQCVPCKLCGGHAVITDAGAGNGYYINCSNYSSFQTSRGCMIDQQRLGGWAYNVMDWWNRLHTAAPATEQEVLERALDKIDWHAIHAFQDELRKGQDIYEDAGGFMARSIKALFGIKPTNPIQNHRDAAAALIAALALPAPVVEGDVGAVRDAANALLMAMTTRALRGRDHVPSMRDEQNAKAALAAALSEGRSHG